MQIKHFFGIDVSKNTLDVCVVVEGKCLQHHQLGNRPVDIKRAFAKIMKALGATPQDSIFCMEHTGMYNLPLIQWLQSQQGKIWLESGAHIRKTLGLVRGKNDKVDSARIAMFAFTHRHNIKLWTPPREAIARLAALLSQRARLVKAFKQINTANTEQNLFLDKQIMKTLNKHSKKILDEIKKQIKGIEQELLKLIEHDQTLSGMYRIITSVDGIGPITACNILVTTNEFISISSPKKFACYSGVAPFEYSSGSSIRGKKRVSHLANKDMKTLLHMAAIAAIQKEGDIRDFYLRKVAEGKNKMSVLNAIRNKLILRVFACVKQNREYEKIYCYKLA